MDLLAADSSDKTGGFTEAELALKEEEFLPIVEAFAADEEMFLAQFASGWTYLMTADRFKNNVENICSGVNTPTLSSQSYC